MRLQELSVTEDREEDNVECKLLTGELLADMGLGGGSDTEAEGSKEE